MNLDQLARYIDHISDTEGGVRDIPAMTEPTSPGRHRRALIAVAAAMVLVVGVATWAVSRHSDDFTRLRFGGLGPTGTNPATREPPLMYRSLPGVVETRLPTNTPYAKTLKSALNLDKFTIVQRGYFAGHDVWMVSDEVNRFNPGNRVNLATGYQATIYHQIYKPIIREHDSNKYLGKSETRVGRAWYGPQDGSVAAMVVNNKTGVIVRVRYQDADNRFPPANTIIDKAVALSKNQSVLDQVKNPRSNTPPTKPDLTVESFAHFYDVSDPVQGDWQELVPTKYRPCQNDGEETQLKVRVQTLRKDGGIAGYLVFPDYSPAPTPLAQGASSACSGGSPDPQGNDQIRSWTTPCSAGQQVQGRWSNNRIPGPNPSLSAVLKDC